MEMWRNMVKTGNGMKKMVDTANAKCYCMLVLEISFHDRLRVSFTGW